MLKNLLLLVLLIPSLNAVAETSVWVTDQLEVQIRSGPGNQFKVIKSILAGTELTIVRGSVEKNGYSHVLLEPSEEGWIATRYLSLSPVAHAQAEENSKTLKKLQAENQRLAAELAAMKAAKESIEKSSEALTAETSRLNSEVIAIRQASASALQIQSERDTLTADKRALVSELEMLKRENSAQDTNNKQNWFMIGAAVLFGGILLGVMLPRLSWRKKTSWETF